MPWKECHVVDERVRFVARLLDGEKMATLCEEFGISRKTGYKIYDRYKDCGVRGLNDRSRRPFRHANQLPAAVEKSIVRLKREYPSWGAPKIREKLKDRWPELQRPAISTVHAVLDRHGLVRHRRRTRRPRATGTLLSEPVAPNALWCADYKGEFLLANRRYCYPLTITDFASRYLIACEALSTTKERYAFPVFERAFEEYGLPRAIRTDNGTPFASAHALYGLSKLAVWWLRSAFSSSALHPGTPKRMGGTSACISPSKRKPPGRRRPTAFNSKHGSIDSSSASTTSARIRPSTCKRPRAGMRRQPGCTAASRTSIIRITIGRPSSRPAAASAINGERLTSARYSRVKRSASSRWPITSGWSPSCTTI